MTERMAQGHLDPYAPLVFDRDSSRADSGAPPQSPARIFWRQLRKSPLAIAGGVILAVFYLLAIFAPFVAPYSEEEMDRAALLPSPAHGALGGRAGAFHLRPFIRQTRLADPSAFTYEEVEGQERPIRFFVRGAPYTTALGIIPSTITCSASKIRPHLPAGDRFVRAG